LAAQERPYHHKQAVGAIAVDKHIPRLGFQLPVDPVETTTQMRHGGGITIGDAEDHIKRKFFGLFARIFFAQRLQLAADLLGIGGVLRVGVLFFHRL